MLYIDKAASGTAVFFVEDKDGISPNSGDPGAGPGLLALHRRDKTTHGAFAARTRTFVLIGEIAHPWALGRD